MKTLILASLAALAVAAPALEDRDLSEAMTWTGDLQLGTGEVTLNGTIESIWSQVLEANPNFVMSEVPEAPETTHEGLEKRAYNFNCHKFDGKRTPKDKAIDQFNFLYALGGLCGIKQSCTRVSCSYKSAIWACSKNGGLKPPCANMRQGRR